MLYFVIIFLCFCVGYFILWVLGFVKVKNKVNPYIEAHKIRNANDRNYDNYIKWLDKNNGALPIDKIKTKEEIEFENEINTS